MSLPQSQPRQYEEFLEFFTRDRERLFRYIFSLVPNHADAEDIFQRCSLLLWRKFPEFDVDRSFLSWACGVALNEVRNFLRTVDRKRLTFDSDLLSQLSKSRLGEFEFSGDVLAHLSSCLDALPRQDRELVQIAYGDQETVKEFADRAQLALQTLYNRLGRIRRQLLDCVRRKLVVES